jgi:hypothetical protein
MDRHVDIDVDIAGPRKDRVLLLFNGLKLADDATDVRLDVLGHRLEIDRRSGRAAHHGRAAGEKADARKPPETLWSPAVNSASKYLTSDRDAAEMSAALAMFIPWFALGPAGCSSTRFAAAQCFVVPAAILFSGSWQRDCWGTLSGGIDVQF